jgi:hypothetical protein
MDLTGKPPMLARGIQLAGFFIDPLRSARCRKNTETSSALLTRLEPLARQILSPLQIGYETLALNGRLLDSALRGAVKSPWPLTVGPKSLH